MPRPALAFDDGGRDRNARWRLVRWIAPLLLVPIVLLTSWYTVPSDSVGVVLRFGAFRAIEEPGLHFKLPLGMDAVRIVATRRQMKLEFGFGSRDATNYWQIGDDAAAEKSMVTGDLSAALVEWVVQYHVGDPRQYLFHVRDPEQTLRDLSEAVMREVVGDRTVDEVITVGRQEIEDVAAARLRAMANTYELGVAVDNVQLQNVNPPSEVQASFNEVNKAQQDREAMINVANGDYNKTVPRAQGEAARRISEAEGYRLQRVNEALGNAAAFDAVLAEYSKAPTVTRTRLYLETMKEVLPQLRDKWIVDATVTQILPMLPGVAGKGAGK